MVYPYPNKLIFYRQTKYIHMENKLDKKENKIRKEKGKQYYLKELKGNGK